MNSSIHPPLPDSSVSKDPSRNAFWVLFKRCIQIGGSVDVFLFFLFHWLGSPILAWVNIISVAMYVSAYRLLLRRRNKLAVALVWLEVLGHSTLGILMLGWESGVHYYMLLFVPLTIASTTTKQALPAVIGLWAYYIGLYLLTHLWLDPLQPISVTANLILSTVNISIVFAMLTYLVFLQIRAVASAQKRLNKLATTDPLTNLFNRRHVLEMASYEINRRARNHAPLSLLIADLDHFKTINDTYGHEGGDQVLKAVAEVLRRCVRNQDTVARWGGEEFLVILPDCDLNQAGEAGERIRCAVEALSLQINDSAVQITLTLGGSQYRGGEKLEACIDRADRALYVGKKAGRNRVQT